MSNAYYRFVVKTTISVSGAMLFVSVACAAIDTMNRRSSAGGEKEPVPDSGVDAGDRAQLSGEYRGFFDPTTASTTASTGGFTIGYPFWDRRRRR